MTDSTEANTMYRLEESGANSIRAQSWAKGSRCEHGSGAGEEVEVGFMALTGRLKNLSVDRPFIAKPLMCNGVMGGLWESCMCTVKVADSGVAIYYEAYHPR